MNKKNLGRLALCTLLLALLGGCLYLNTLMPIITGYAAKNLASAVFVSGRNQQDVEQLDLNFSFIKYTRNKVDYASKTVTSRFLWASSTAAYREGKTLFWHKPTRSRRWPPTKKPSSGAIQQK